MAESERLGASFSIDVTNLKAGLTQANRLIRESQSEFKAAAAGMDDWTKSEDGLNAKIKSLNEITEIQKKKVSALKTEYQNLIDNGLDPSSKAASDLRIKINNEEAALRSNEAELARQEDALKNVGKESDNAGGKFEKLGEIAKKAGEVAAAAFTAAAAAVGGLVKSAVGNFADYEQLVGGVDTLFKDSSQKVQDYAANAYKTAGLSANDYMETVTGFSASLLQSLGGDTKKAAEKADMAITDMADNANKMGTAIESIQNAYGGFAKGNYTMLDNLKLGYGGTQDEMYRLLQDAAKLNEEFANTANFSMDGKGHLTAGYADIVDAIHIVQTEMGITGTTAQEASSTISGSVSSLKSAWSNLLTGFANEDADLDMLIQNVVDGIDTALDNLLPVIERSMSSLIAGFKEIIPKLTPILSEILPELVSAAGELVVALIKEIPNIVAEVGKAIPEILTALLQDAPEVLEKVLDGLDWIKRNAATIEAGIAGIAAAFAAYKVASLIIGIVTAFQDMTIAMKAAAIAQEALNLVMSLNPIGLIVAAIAGLVAAFVVLWNKSDEFREFWINLWDNIKNAFSAVVDWISNAFKTIANWLKNNWPSVLMMLVNPLAGIFKIFYDNCDGFRDFVNNLTEKIKGFFVKMWDGIKAVFSPAVQWFSQLFGSVYQTFSDIFYNIGVIVKGCWEVIKAVWKIAASWFNTTVIEPVKGFFTTMWGKISEGASKAWDGIKSVFGALANWFNSKVLDPIVDLGKKLWTPLKNGASSAWEGIKEVFGKVGTFFSDTFSKAWQKVKDVFSTGGQVFDGIKDGIVSAFKSIVNALINGINKVIATPFNSLNSVLEKIKSVKIAGIQPFSGLKTISVPQIPQLAKGGVVKSATNAIIGEDGAEAVVPLERNKEWIKAVAKELADASGEKVVVNQTNNYSQAHSRYELYKSKQQTAAAVRLALGV